MDGIPARLTMAVRISRVKPVVPGILGQVDGRRDAQRHTRDGGAQGQEHRANQRRHDAAFGHTVPRRLGEKGPAQGWQPLPDHVADHKQDRNHDDKGSQGDKRHGDPMGLLAFHS